MALDRRSVHAYVERMANRGQRLLRDHVDGVGLVNQTENFSWLAEDLGVSHSTIESLALGRRLPGRRIGLVLERRLGIPIESWDEPVEVDQ